MTNPINPLNRSTTASTSGTENKVQTNNIASQSENKASSSSNAEDTVSLSQESKHVSGLQQQLKDSAAVDMAKVELIKQEIANGNYPLDAEKIAKNMVNLEQSLLE